MVDSLVDSLVSLAIEKLAEVVEDEVALLVGVTNEIEKLSRTFILIQAVLKDAETRRVKDEAVKIWLQNVKDMAYDVDDILDEWRTEALKSQAPDEGDGSCFSKKKVRSFLSPVTCFNHVVLRHKIGSRIKEVRGRLNDITKEASQLGLRVDSGERERVHGEVRQAEIREREIGSLIDQSSMVGREGEKNEVLDLLLLEVTKVPFVISIVGMGGLGKTTLAQLAYNDEKVKGHFDLRMWVCVSEDFDLKQITKSIIESGTGSSCEHLDLDLLQNRLHEMLDAKRFLLVLDDIWSEDSEKWDKLRVPFQAGALGSRIVITTRSEKVALAMGRSHIYKLGVLSDDNCWLLFSRRALDHRNAEECLELEEIGRKIVNKCGGVPLAAKTIGSAMCSRRMRREWERVLDSEIWKSGDVLGGILPALLLSYHDLPPALKQCFAYCSIFPKDWMIEKDVIVKLWVAQGFIRSKGSEDKEEIGGLYFDDLLRRSLLQDAELDYYKNIVGCKMHDLVHDLAQSVAGSNSSLVEIGKQALLNLKIVRHSFINISDEAGDETDDETDDQADEVASIWATVHKAHKLRTLLIKSRMTWLVHSSISRVPHDLFHHLRRLRALDLSYSSIKKLPRTVGQLKHLRYLDLSCTSVEELPEVMSNCGNLQTLRLNVCLKLRKLPRGMRKMLSLRHLELKGTDMLKYLPQGMGRLTGLQTFTNFIAGGGDDVCKCGELKHLNHLQGRLEISGMENISRDEARDAELFKKQQLHALHILCEYGRGEPLDDEVKRIEDVLELLQPHKNLKQFIMWNYQGSKLPKWIEDPVFSNLVKIELWECYKCKQLPGLGKLPALKYLRINGMKEVRKVGGEFSGDDNNKGSGGGCVSFPKLETLFFSKMPNWEEWELRGGEGEIMPSLLELQIGDCPKLKDLPSNLPLLLQKLSLNMSNEGMPSGRPLPILPNLKHLVVMGDHWYSYELTSLPCNWLGNLKALQTLKIESCRRLGSLPEELQKLTMLQELMIWDCPLLEERCRDGGEDWGKIARIPRISIK